MRVRAGTAPATRRQLVRNATRLADKKLPPCPTYAGVRKAAARKLEHELGIPTQFELDEFAYLTRIHYYAPSDEVWAEHESEHHSSWPAAARS